MEEDHRSLQLELRQYQHLRRTGIWYLHRAE